MLNYSLCQDGLLHRLCMVDPTSLLWSVRNPFHFIVCAWLIVPALYGTSGHEEGYFGYTKHLYKNICKFIVFSSAQENYSCSLSIKA